MVDKDFKDTEYYKLYVDKIESYKTQIIESTMNQQGIDNEYKFTRGDVLKEVYKFISSELIEFKDTLDLNPNRARREKIMLEMKVEQQAKEMLGMN